MPINYNITAFLNNEGNIIKSIISDEGENNIKSMAEDLSINNPNNRDDKAINVNQLRKFYDNFLKIYYTESEENIKKVQLLMLKAQVQYAVKRLKIERFGKFLQSRINLIVKKNNEEFIKNLDAFKLNFEALVGYFPK